MFLNLIIIAAYIGSILAAGGGGQRAGGGGGPGSGELFTCLMFNIVSYQYI